MLSILVPPGARRRLLATLCVLLCVISCAGPHDQASVPVTDESVNALPAEGSGDANETADGSGESGDADRRDVSVEPTDWEPEVPEDYDGVDDRDGQGEWQAGRVLLGCGYFLLAEQIDFEYDDEEIRPRSYPILDDVVDVLRVLPELEVRIDGHVSYPPDDESWQWRSADLSENRARSVREYLVHAGIEPSRLQSVGYGNTRPIADYNLDEGRARNRRVELWIIGGDIPGCEHVWDHNGRIETGESVAFPDWDEDTFDDIEDACPFEPGETQGCP